MSDQLSLLEAAGRVYGCCGLPCGELPPAYTAGPEAAAKARAMGEVPWPHAEDCPNPNLGSWSDRATGWPLRRLHCIAADGSCPYGGRLPARPGLADPYGGRCCIDLKREAQDAG